MEERRLNPNKYQYDLPDTQTNAANKLDEIRENLNPFAAAQYAVFKQ